MLRQHREVLHHFDPWPILRRQSARHVLREYRLRTEDHLLSWRVLCTRAEVHQPALLIVPAPRLMGG